MVWSKFARISSAGSSKRESYKISLALQPEARGGGSHRAIPALIKDCFSLPPASNWMDQRTRVANDNLGEALSLCHAGPNSHLPGSSLRSDPRCETRENGAAPRPATRSYPLPNLLRQKIAHDPSIRAATRLESMLWRPRPRISAFCGGCGGRRGGRRRREEPRRRWRARERRWPWCWARREWSTRTGGPRGNRTC